MAGHKAGLYRGPLCHVAIKSCWLGGQELGDWGKSHGDLWPQSALSQPWQWWSPHPRHPPRDGCIAWVGPAQSALYQCLSLSLHGCSAVLDEPWPGHLAWHPSQLITATSSTLSDPQHSPLWWYMIMQLTLAFITLKNIAMTRISSVYFSESKIVYMFLVHNKILCCSVYCHLSLPFCVIQYYSHYSLYMT